MSLFVSRGGGRSVGRGHLRFVMAYFFVQKRVDQGTWARAGKPQGPVAVTLAGSQACGGGGYN